MERLPAEIHAYIAYLSCFTDHGPTIRSFGLVSRYFAQICRPFLYQTISVDSEESILSLAEVLLKQPHDSFLDIRYMFIAYPELASGGANLQNQLMQLITRCAPTLRSLAFDCTRSLPTSTSLFSRIFRLSFPSLQELTLAGFYPFPNPHPSPRFPGLRRLHLHGNRNPHGLLQIGNLEGSCPNLTDLRISGLSMASTFALELGEALDSHSSQLNPSSDDIPDSPCTSLPPSPLRSRSNSGTTSNAIADMFPTSTASPIVKFPAKLPHSVKHVSIHPAPELEIVGSGGTRGHSRTHVLKDQAMMASLKEIVTGANATRGDSVGIVDSGVHSGGEFDAAADAEIKGVRYTLLPRATRMLSTPDFREEWKRRISGQGDW